RETRVTAAEVVHGQAESGSRQLSQYFERLLTALHQRGFGYFQFDLGRRYPLLIQHVGYIVDDAAIAKLQFGEVDGELRHDEPASGPRTQLPARRAQDEKSDSADQPRLLGDRDELAW